MVPFPIIQSIQPSSEHTVNLNMDFAGSSADVAFEVSNKKKFKKSTNWNPFVNLLHVHCWRGGDRDGFGMN